MIKLIKGEQKGLFMKEIDAMHQLRKKVFMDRLIWEVPIINNWEIDGYDALNPVYLLSYNESDRLIGCVRFLPTIGFNMLNDTFSQLLPEGKRIESPLIWESSRFAIDRDADSPIGPKGVSRATSELLIAMTELGMKVGLTHVVSVFDALMRRILMRAGNGGELIGPPQRIGTVMTYAAFFETNQAAADIYRRASGIDYDVWIPEPLSIDRAA